jgi:hypothetical protein
VSEVEHIEAQKQLSEIAQVYREYQESNYGDHLEVIHHNDYDIQ